MCLITGALLVGCANNTSSYSGASVGGQTSSTASNGNDNVIGNVADKEEARIQAEKEAAEAAAAEAAARAQAEAEAKAKAEAEAQAAAEAAAAAAANSSSSSSTAGVSQQEEGCLS